MSYRYRPKNAEVDPDNPRAWGQCDRCGMWWNLHMLSPQMAYRGSATPVPTGFLVCPKHLDPLNPQDAPAILPPDPTPVMNARPDIGAIDEAGPTQDLEATIATSEASITSFFVDLYDGDPAGDGESVLETLTGAATRTDFADQMAAAVDDISTNDEAIEVVEAAVAGARVAYVVIFDAATDGNILMKGALHLPQTVTLYNGAAFAIGALRVALNT